ncbi:Imm8 family immunity protein [Actinacidiphila oryziradicis]|uniref:Uncharacterized protein n=1 Tax=Actinacidiphila oryziradicis TaxID=2571141 RepID=A0A4V6WIZ2_9ACTN|nr:Imm8 family immunity protein [Actinacidiphila oryziradicis]TJZ99268.1 hypothetical protein FCI23_46420 [Actinacidiphila oryziradicis]
MRAQIRHLLTPDIDPTTFAPEDPERFMFVVQLLAGPCDGEGEESFQFIVCTPGWLQDRVSREGPMPGVYHVIVGSFDWPALETFFQRLVSQCAGADWNEVATKLSRHGLYEFADWTP